jgi:hypothetical protein
MNKGCFKHISYYLAVFSAFTYFTSILSDLYAAYGLFTDTGVPKTVFGAFVVVIIVSWILSLTDIYLARSILEQDDLSATIIDDLASRMFQARSLGHYGLVQTVMENFGWKEKALFAVVSGLQNGKRLVFVAIPQTIVLSIAIHFRNKVPNSTAVLSYALNFISLSVDLMKLVSVLYFYSCLKCCLAKDMSMWDSLNLKVEKTLNKMLKKHPEWAASPGAPADSFAPSAPLSESQHYEPSAPSQYY